MSAWQNIKKHAASFGVKGFLYGALAGAALGVIGCLMGAGILYGISGLGLSGVLEAMGGLAGTTVEGAAGTSVGIALGGAKLLELPFVATVSAIVAGAGALVGAVSGTLMGCAYGAATDESNPLPRVVDAAANKILTKTPQLAKAIATKVGMQEAASAQLAQSSEPAPPVDAPVITTMPSLVQKQQQQPPSFSERITSQQSKEPELAVAQR